MPNIILAFLFSIFHIDGILLRCIPFRGELSRKQKKLLLTAYLLFLAANGCIMYWVFEYLGVSLATTKVDYFAVPVILTVINILIIPGRTREHLFVYGIVAVCNFMLSAFPTFFISKILGLDIAFSIFLLVILQMLLQLACFLPTRKLLKKTVEPFLFIDSGKYWHSIWFIPIAMLLAVMVLFPGNVHVSTVSHLISRGCIGIATILMCYSIAADHKLLHERHAMTEQLMDQKLHYAQLQTKVEEARRQAHDFKHHIAAIRHFIDEDDKEGLRQYCTALLAQTTVQSQTPYTGNSAVDGVMYRYMQLAREHDIELSCVGTIHSQGLEDVDLCVLLGNALDNALAGCCRIDEGRSILVAAQTEGNLLSVMVRNSFDGVILQRNDTILSRKRDNSTGVGLSSMRSICDRNDGQMQVSWDEKTFTVLFLLPLKDE